jgi:hypothetical protein
MAFLYSNTCECVKSELDLFAGPTVQTSVLDNYDLHCKPLAPVSDSGAIEFLVPGNGDEYIDTARTLLMLKVKITKDDNSPVTGAIKVGPVNNFFHSLIQQVDIFLNQKLISPPSTAYPYRSYIETILNYDKPAKDSHLTTVLFYKDTAGKMDEFDENQGMKARTAHIAAGKTVDMIGSLHCDIFNQSRYMLNGVEMKIKLIRSRESFHLMAPTETGFKTHIEDALLIVRKVRVSPSVLLAHERVLRKTAAKYPISRVDVKNITIPAGVTGKSIDNIFIGALPKRIIMGFVSNAAFNGDTTKNPFNFAHHNVDFVQLYADGQQIPSRALQPDFIKGNYVREYHSLYSGTGIHHQDEGNGISRADYPNGYMLLAFDLTPDQSANMGHWSPARNGNLRVEVRFTKALEEALTCILYAEFNSMIEISHLRDVTVDYSN